MKPTGAGLILAGGRYPEWGGGMYVCKRSQVRTKIIRAVSTKSTSGSQKTTNLRGQQGELSKVAEKG